LWQSRHTKKIHFPGTIESGPWKVQVLRTNHCRHLVVKMQHYDYLS
jgi:hypothetical protein